MLFSGVKSQVEAARVVNAERARSMARREANRVVVIFGILYSLGKSLVSAFFFF
jgi:hypothetical protein